MTATFSAPDIECDGCANAIRRALGSVHGVAVVSVDVPAKSVTVTYEAPISSAEVIGALDKAGFPAVEIGGVGPSSPAKAE